MAPVSRHTRFSFDSLGHFICRHPRAVTFAWVVLALFVSIAAPRWDDVTYDGDLAYMPATMTSVQAERLLERAFPDERSKSEMVIVAVREDRVLSTDDLAAIDRIAARFYNLLGVSRYLEAEQIQQRAKEAGTGNDLEQRIAAKRAGALAAWQEAERLDEEYAEPLHNQSLEERRAGHVDEADRLQQLADDYSPRGKFHAAALRPADGEILPFLDIWTRHTDVVGSKLRSRDKKAELILLRLSQEFMATDNMRVLKLVHGEIERAQKSHELPKGLQILVTGSAAVGGDMLQSAAESIQNTELYTVLMVLGILIVVYRSPLLIAVPLITLAVSVAVATGLVAWMTQWNHYFGWDWWQFRIFTTTRIFVVVILFGAGTDFCLFLIARYKEELESQQLAEPRGGVLPRTLTGVGNAIVASAMTTILGLATMYFAEFGKFRNSGPAIGLCLMVTLAACLTLAPALLALFGPHVFWPWGYGTNLRRRSGMEGSPRSSVALSGDMASRGDLAPRVEEASGWTKLWTIIAHQIVAHPGLVLLLSLIVLAPWAVWGSRVEVTYDFLSELSAERMSKRGARAMREHFPIGESGPLVVLAQRPRADLDSPEGKQAIQQLTRDLYLPGVQAVRSLAEPRGDEPQGFSIKKAALQSHQLTRSLYLSQRPELQGDVARLELLLDDDPFSFEAMSILNDVSHHLHQMAVDTTSYWHDAKFYFGGTTAAIRDLREVTSRDSLRIQILVTLAVLAVLLVILRRPLVCFYLILTVLFTYYVTLGCSQWIFQSLYGPEFEGLDWKVPLFLFVILVAVGQDYNIYLATRVFEEQAQHGLFGGLRRAIIRTGGIITSCGVIMAGTFVSMASGSLRGVVELGVALSLGVLLDTFVVRPILVPAFLALLFRTRSASPRIGSWMTRPALTSVSSHYKG